MLQSGYGGDDQQAEGEVRGFVFGDCNTDGHWSEGELPVVGEVVRLVDATGDVVAVTRTNSEGEYLFAHVPAGQYRLEAEPGPEWAGAVSPAFAVHNGTATVAPLGQPPSAVAATEEAAPAAEAASPVKEPVQHGAANALFALLGAALPTLRSRKDRRSAATARSPRREF
jgi:hypothetical protein